MTILDSILKSRDITLSTKVHLIKAMVFPVVLHGCESWTIKSAEHQRIDAFELWCWRRLLRVPWRLPSRSNQSILKETGPEYSLEGLMLKLKLQYFGHLIRRTDSFEKTLMLGKIRRSQWQPTPVLLPGQSHGWRSLVGYSPWGHEESDTTERLHFHFSLSCTGEGNGNPLQYSCLDNPMDGGAW